MKTIGVIGGIGPQATIDFEARVHTVAQRIIPQQWNRGYPPMVVLYLRNPPFLLTPDHTPQVPWRPDPRLLDAAAKLGAISDFLVITSNGTHVFQSQIEQASGRKVLSMIDATAKEIQQRGWCKLGVLGLGEPVVYTKPLRELGITCQTIDGEMRDALDKSIVAVLEGRNNDESASVAQQAIDTLRGRGVDGIILGCTEIPFLLSDSVAEPDLINPLQLLAEAVVRHAMAE